MAEVARSTSTTRQVRPAGSAKDGASATSTWRTGIGASYGRGAQVAARSGGP